jgi:hypothetical protein
MYVFFSVLYCQVQVEVVKWDDLLSKESLQISKGS